MLAARDRGCTKTLSISRKKCIEQINLLERQWREIERELDELRQIYTCMFVAPDMSRTTRASTRESR